MSDEEWRPIVGWEGLYEVSDQGRVRSLDRRTRTGIRRGKVLAPASGPRGHKFVSLKDKPRKKLAFVHRLVLTAFVGPCPAGMEACHWDGNPANNRVRNLRWDTHAENTRDRVRHGTHHMAMRTHCPRGHALKMPNLTATSVRKGQRECLACSRARGRAGAPEHLAEANAQYEKIMHSTFGNPAQLWALREAEE